MSKNKFFYDSLEDSQRRLNSTVVLFQGSPVWIQNVIGLSKDQQAEIIHLPWKGQKGGKDVVPLTPQYFTIRNLPPLGYVDYDDFSHYCSRIPSRQGKQGLCRNNVSVSHNPDGMTPNFENLLEKTSCVDMLTNKYPGFDKVYQEIVASDEALKRAFSKTMALHIDDMESIIIEHRGVKVAVTNNARRTGPVFRLVNKFAYLKEEFQENGIKLEA